MAQAQTQPQPQPPTTNNTSTNGEGSDKREPRVVTAVEAITKISKILDQLSPNDRKRVLAFVTASEGEGNE